VRHSCQGPWRPGNRIPSAACASTASRRPSSPLGEPDGLRRHERAGLRPQRDRNGNACSPLRGSEARACRDTGCIGTHWSSSLLANDAGSTSRLPSKLTHGIASDWCQRKCHASERRSPAHQPHSRKARHSGSGAFSSSFSKASAGIGWGDRYVIELKARDFRDP